MNGNDNDVIDELIVQALKQLDLIARQAETLKQVIRVLQNERRKPH